MMKNAIVIVAIVAATAGPAGAFSAGPFDGLTGAPGEGVCTACHSTFPLNSGTGSLDVVLPAAYQPGDTYDLTVTLVDPDAVRWGFELTVLSEADTTSAGTLSSIDGSTQVSTGGALGRAYVKHTTAGTQQGQTGSGSWTFAWTAPPVGTGDLVVYVAANAANGNGFSSGDRIYTASTPFAEAAGTAIAAALPSPVGLTNAPNPFNPSTEVAFDLVRAGRVRLSVYALDGRRIADLHDGELAAGGHAFTWRGMDDAGRAVPSGVYLAHLRHATGSTTRRMVLLR